MNNYPILYRSPLVAEYIGKDIFICIHQRAIKTLKTANLYVESPYHTYASVICQQRAQRN